MRNISMTAAAVSGCLALAPCCGWADGNSDDWQFSATLYGWFPDIGGNTRFQAGGGGTIDVDISQILDHLKMTMQGSFEASKGQWGAFTDVVYLDVGEANSHTRNLEINGIPLPATVTTTLDFDLKSLFWTLAGSYRVVDSDATTFDVLLGARLATFKPALDWVFSGTSGPIQSSGSREESVEQWDAIVGARGRISFGSDRRWVMPYHFDLGTGDSELTFQAIVGLAYTFKWGDLGVAWRYLDYDLEPGPVTDMNFSGPAVGAAFHW